ncbi:MAG: hypothetical protein ACHWZW_23190 [Spirulina sp.]
MQRFTPSWFSSAVIPAGVGGGVALAALVGVCPAAMADTLAAWQFDPATQQLTLTLPAEVTPQYALTSEGLVLTLPNVALGSVPTTATYDGPVQQIQLLPRENGIDILLTLAPGATWAEEPGQWVSMAAADQTRWVFTPRVAQAAVADATPGAETAPGMIVELPPLPADPNLSWPYTGVGRLSISAANLMQPANLDTFNTLPDTLAIDPFNLGLPDVAQQVTVPSLEELDAAVGVPLPNPTVVVPSLGNPQIASGPSGVTTGGVIVAPPPGSQPSPGSVAAAPATVPAPAVVPPQASSNPAPNSTLPPAQVVPPQPTVAQGLPPSIDQENNGLAIPISPAPTVTPPTATAPSMTAPSAPTVAPPSATISTPPPMAGGNPVAQGPSRSTPGGSPAVTAPTTTVEPPFLTVPPPTAASPTVANQPPATDNRLAVPNNPPSPTVPGVVIPPNLAAEPIPVAVAPDAAISFGQPLPGGLSGSDPIWGDRRLAPDTLIAAGSILELRYTGPASLTLDPGTVHQEVLVLETEIRDPVTNGIVAPAGSQLIGQFQARGDGHQWVSQMLIAPNGQRIPFASTSEYVYNSPQLSGGGLALGTGLGALALTLLTGFSGIGLLGGALIGATAAVGTAPQMLVIEPNQVIYAEVMQDIYRAMPIAAMPAETQEWGAVPGTWVTP